MEKQKINLSAKDLMEKYSELLLSEGKRPSSVYLFMKKLGFEEKDFYQFYSGFDSIEKEILIYFFNQSVDLTKETEDYQALTSKEKLLNFYYIFFENLNMNRSLVLMILYSDFKSKIIKLKYLRTRYIEFIRTLDLNNLKVFEKMPDKFKNYSERPKEEALWLHFLSVLKFWKYDQSAGFEKTDLYIEKSLDTGFEIIDNPIMEKFIDLGKFLLYERFK